MEPDGVGWLRPAPRQLAERVDRRKDILPSEEIDCGWIGEDHNGIWCYMDPYFAYLDQEELWTGVLAARVDPKMRAADSRMPCFDFMVKAQAVAALHRAAMTNERV